MWAYGGLYTQPGGANCQEVGMQTLVNDIRGLGANNVIILPGLGGENTLRGMPLLSDPASPSSPQFAYGVHYPSLTGGLTVWDRNFGALSATVPVIVTEWYASSIHNCIPNEPARAALLLAYLASKQIGVVGYAFDVPGTIVSGWSYAPTTYANFSCGPPGAGPGQLLFDEFGGLAQADGPSIDDPQGWVIDYPAMRRLSARAAGLVRHFFNTPRAFVIGTGAGSLRRLKLEAAIPTASFSSVPALSAAVNGHTLPTGTRAVMFNDTNASSTPTPEQRRPAQFYRRAARIAHRHGLLFIAAPDPSLILAQEPKASLRKTYSRFLGLRIAAAAARYADVYAIQAGGLETQNSSYSWFVQSAAFQAAQAHPGIELLAGVTSAPTGRKRSYRTLLSAFNAAGPAVSGYWLSDPPLPGCALCPGPHDGTALAFLRALRSKGV
jgi:hypothetical protein